MSTPLRVLFIEDCEDSCVLIAGELQNLGYEPVYLRVDTAPAMRQALAEREWDVIIADYVVPGFDALASLNVAQEVAPDLPVIVVSGNLGEEVAVTVMKAGAQDYITKPWSNDELIAQISQAIEGRRLREENVHLKRALKQRYNVPNIIGKSEKMLAVLDLVTQVAPSRSTCRRGAARAPG